MSHEAHTQSCIHVVAGL